MSISINTTPSGEYNARLLNHAYGLYLKTALGLGVGPAFGRRSAATDDTFISQLLPQRLASLNYKIAGGSLVAQKPDSGHKVLPPDLWNLYMFDSSTVDLEKVYNMTVFLRDQIQYRIATALLAQANIDRNIVLALS